MSKNIRVATELYVRVQALAENEKRSVTNMLHVLLSEALDARKK